MPGPYLVYSGIRSLITCDTVHVEQSMQYCRHRPCLLQCEQLLDLSLSSPFPVPTWPIGALNHQPFLAERSQGNMDIAMAPGIAQAKGAGAGLMQLSLGEHATRIAPGLLLSTNSPAPMQRREQTGPAAVGARFHSAPHVFRLTEIELYRGGAANACAASLWLFITALHSIFRGIGPYTSSLRIFSL